MPQTFGHHCSSLFVSFLHYQLNDYCSINLSVVPQHCFDLFSDLFYSIFSIAGDVKSNGIVTDE
jgi:hypothetical protein